MKIFITDNHNPLLNLSIENWLLTRKDIFNEELIFLYRNTKSVIIGRFQNPWLECDLKKMTENNVSLARRQSGGGAVYHDLGNTNFVFISNKEDFIKEEKTGTIIRALHSLGIEANEGDRSDIYVQNRKISGSASKYSSSRVLHHGTLLIEADLKALNTFLITKEYKTESIQSKGIASVRSKVANLNEFDKTLNHKIVCDAIIEELKRNCDNSVDIIMLKETEIRNIEELRIQQKTLSHWDWVYGKTPSFTIKAPLILGDIQKNCQFSIIKGIISEIILDNQRVDPHDIELIKKKFIHKKCDLFMHLLDDLDLKT